MIEQVILASGHEIAETYQSKFVDEVRQFHRVHQQIVDLISDHQDEAAGNLWRKHLQAKIRRLKRIRQEGSRDSTLVEVS